MSLRILRIHIRIMVAMQARMCRCPSDGGGEATAIITITDTTADIAMVGMGGIHGGIGKRVAILKKL
jgi:hypothetical protein